MCARRVAHFSPRRGRLASSSTGCNRTAATNCKLSAGRPGETGPIRHHFHHLHHRPPSIILRVICSALLRESKKTCPRHRHAIRIFTVVSLLIEFCSSTLFFFACPSRNKTSKITRFPCVRRSYGELVHLFFSKECTFSFLLNRPT